MSATSRQPAAASVLDVSGIGVALSGRRILHDVSFSVAPGEFVGLIGSNGAGKTTLLRVILGLQHATSGTVSFDVEQRERGGGVVGYLPQKVALDPDLPLRSRDVVALGLDGQKPGIPLPSSRRRRLVDEMLAAVDASAFADTRIGLLSGGQQQRVLIAHALVSSPRLLLLDEPLANLDIRSAQEIVDLLARVGRERGVAVLLSAHDLNPLLPVMDRIVYLEDGRAVSGATDEVVQSDVLTQAVRPARRRAAGRGQGARGRGSGRRSRAPRHERVLRQRPVQLALDGRDARRGGLRARRGVHRAASPVVRGPRARRPRCGRRLLRRSCSASASYWGFVGAGIIAAGLMELVGIKRVQGRDVATGIVFGLGLGFTALFLYLDTQRAGTSNAAISVLFGSLFVIDPSVLPLVVVLSVVACLIVVVSYRWMLVDSLSQDLAAVRRIPVRMTGILFLVALALAVELSALTIGAVLSTALLIAPAAAALRLTCRVGFAILIAVGIGVGSTWLGILISYDSYSAGSTARTAGR